MERLLERLGYASQWLTDTLRDGAAAAADGGEHLQDEAGGLLDRAGDLLPDGVSAEMIGAATSAVGAWVASRYLVRGRVRWSRAVLAGVAGTLVYDAIDRVDRLRSDGISLDPGALRSMLADEGEDADWSDVGARYGAGVALALFYAGYLHHRLPGPAPLRGALFGALDAVALRWGGLLPLLERLHPELELPTGFAALGHSGEPTRAVVARHVAFGVAVGMAYGND
jgi:hypothetical protein